MGRITKQRQQMVYTSYSHVFHLVEMEGGGYSFTCDKQGNYIPNQSAVRGNINYSYALTGVVYGCRVIDEGIKKYQRTSYEPAVLKCDCGVEVVLRDAMTNCCSNCGAFYNGSVEGLVHPRLWGEETGEKFSDGGVLVL